MTLRNFHSNPSLPTVGLHLRTQMETNSVLNGQIKCQRPSMTTSELLLNKTSRAEKNLVTTTNKHIFNILLFWLNPNGKYGIYSIHLPTIEI